MRPMGRYARGVMDTTGVPDGRPFRYKGNLYRIVAYGITDGEPYATVEPPNDQLVAEIRRRLQRDGTLAVYYGFDANHFPDE